MEALCVYAPGDGIEPCVLLSVPTAQRKTLGASVPAQVGQLVVDSGQHYCKLAWQLINPCHLLLICCSTCSTCRRRYQDCSLSMQHDLDPACALRA
jgi:hypothetical protein